MTLVFLDTETTGLSPVAHQLWEAAYAVDDGPIVRTALQHTLYGADPRALELNGYMTRGGALTTREAHDEAELGEAALRQALTGATVVGANPAFDTAFLRFRWGSAPWHYRLFDIEAYAAGVLGWNAPRGLADIREELVELGFGIPAPDHSAVADVETLRRSFRALQQIASNQSGGLV